MDTGHGKFSAVVLAAGKSTRFKSKSGLSKIFHPLAGIPMVEYVLRVLQRVCPEEIVVVLNPENKDEFLRFYGDLYKVAVQDPPLGTGDALATALPHLGAEVQYALVLSADTPLVTEKALHDVLESASGGDGAVLTFQPEEPRGYGRILRDDEGHFVSQIVEESELDEATKGIKECNSGIYAFELRWLPEVIERARTEFGTKNKKGEYFLTDVARFLRLIPCFYEPAVDLLGINDRAQLNEAENIIQKRIISAHAREGVSFIRAETTYIEADVRIGPDTTIFPGCILRGDTSIGENCEIGPMTYLEDCRIGANSIILYSHLVQVHTEEGVKIGPFANLRPGTVLGEGVKVGDFVEIKNSRIGARSKVPHLSYVGDAEVGSEVNIGAGTITCNYDGFSKYKTVIEDGVFIGSNNTLVAPVRIGKGAYTAAGSTINKDVPQDALAIGRASQENKDGYARKLRERKKAKTEQRKVDAEGS